MLLASDTTIQWEKKDIIYVDSTHTLQQRPCKGVSKLSNTTNFLQKRLQILKRARLPNITQGVWNRQIVTDINLITQHHDRCYAPSFPTNWKAWVGLRWNRLKKKKIRVPDSLVHWSCFAISACVTVGRVLSNDFKKSAILNGGSSNSSELIWAHAFSTAFGSPGEQGVHFFGSPFSVSGFATCLKWVADMTFRTGCIRASRTMVDMSDPEKPSVLSARIR